MTPGIETVLEALEEEGFERLPSPLAVAGASFGFDAAVGGTGVSHDLVVIQEGSSDPQALLRMLSGLNRSLDRVGSRRPVTLVVVGARVKRDALAALENSARVIVVPTDEPSFSDVQEAVAVLLPLRLPVAEHSSADPLSELTSSLHAQLTPDHVALIDAARIDSEAVRATFKEMLESSLPQESGGPQ